MQRIYFYMMTVLALGFIIFSCDTEKYFYSSLEYTQDATDSSLVRGVITRKDNERPVKWAHIRIGYYQTVSDSFGGFRLNIPITPDDNRNMISPIVVSAYNFEKFSSFIYLTPTDMQRDITLIFAAPIIFDAYYTIVVKGPNLNTYRFFATVKDFQGASDVTEVTVIARDVTKNKSVIIPLIKSSEVGAYLSYWASDDYTGDIFADRNGGLIITFKAVDRVGHISTLNKNN